MVSRLVGTENKLFVVRSQNKFRRCCVQCGVLFPPQQSGAPPSTVAYSTGLSLLETAGMFGSECMKCRTTKVFLGCCRQLFEGIEAQRENLHCSVRIMFLEIHNEEVKDLLHPDTPARVLPLFFCPSSSVTLLPSLFFCPSSSVPLLLQNPHVCFDM